MSAFVHRVSSLTGVAEARIERLAGGDLSEILLVRRTDGRNSVAKGGPASATEATMLRALASAGVPVPAVEAEHEDLLLMEYVAADGVFSPHAWQELGKTLKRLHDHPDDQYGDHYGWPVDYRLGTVEMDNRPTDDWPAFWRDRRLLPTASLLDRPWRDRVDRFVQHLPGRLPSAPRRSLLHGDLWTGNILVSGGKVAAFIDPACYFGDCEVDLAMLTLFATPPPQFYAAYGGLEAGWEGRLAAYQLFPALVHLRLFGAGYASLVDRLLGSFGA